MAVTQVVAVTNTSPLIALAAVGEVPLFDELFDTLVVPLPVWAELSAQPGAPSIHAVLALTRARFQPPVSAPPPEAASLHEGERAAITTALALPGSWVLLDEKGGRAVTASLGLSVRGTLGILVEAKRRGLVGSLAPLLDLLRAGGFWLGDNLVKEALRQVGE